MSSSSPSSFSSLRPPKLFQLSSLAAFLKRIEEIEDSEKQTDGPSARNLTSFFLGGYSKGKVFLFCQVRRFVILWEVLGSPARLWQIAECATFLEQIWAVQKSCDHVNHLAILCTSCSCIILEKIAPVIIKAFQCVSRLTQQRSEQNLACKQCCFVGFVGSHIHTKYIGSNAKASSKEQVVCVCTAERRTARRNCLWWLSMLLTWMNFSRLRSFNSY